MTDQRTDEEIVQDALDECGIDPEVFTYGDGDDFECPSCPRSSGTPHGLSLHHTQKHGRLVREAAAGDGGEYREFLERVHTEQRIAPEAIASALADTISPTTIREDCKKLGIYRPRPNSQADSLSYKLDDMDVEEFDAKLAEAGESK